MQNLVFAAEPWLALDAEIDRMAPASVFLLADSNTVRCVIPRLLERSARLSGAQLITTPAGEENKSLEALAAIWRALGNGGATRQSLLVNVGGGVVTDMGAFAAATFKRGMRFVNMPTTLLAAVDASVGGKTGINFNSLKNEVGVFQEADAVVISTCFFDTLDDTQLLSGFAEMVKHALLSSAEMSERLLACDVAGCSAGDLLAMLRESVAVKCRYVNADFGETGLRKALNLGHTFAHAFESLAAERVNRRGGESPEAGSLTHGYAVAFGMVAALVLSRIMLGFPSEWLHRYAAFVTERYGAFAITCDEYPRLIELMHHDKKNRVSDTVLCTLLRALGQVEVDVAVADVDITAALDIYRDLLHIP